MSKTSFGETGKLLDFSDRSSQKKCCRTASINREIVSTDTVQLRIEININKKRENTIINSNVTENFIIRKYIENKKYLI